MADQIDRDGTPVTSQMMAIIAASRILRGHPNSISGSGTPILASLLASTLNPNHTSIFDSGSIAPRGTKYPISVSDGNVEFGYNGPASAVLAGGLQCGKIRSCIVGAAQVDSQGKLNSTWIASRGGMRRLPGSGGASVMASFSLATVVLTSHEPSRFPDRCDFVSSDPTFNSHVFEKKRSYYIVTEKCLLRWSFSEGQFFVKALMPGCAMQDVTNIISFAETSGAPDTIDSATDVERRALWKILGKGAQNWNVAGRTTSKIRNV